MRTDEYPRLKARATEVSADLQFAVQQMQSPIAISGEANSGKSIFAEYVARKLSLDRICDDIYLASKMKTLNMDFDVYVFSMPRNTSMTAMSTYGLWLPTVDGITHCKFINFCSAWLHVTRQSDKVDVFYIKSATVERIGSFKICPK